MTDTHKKKHLPPPPLADILGELPDAPHDSELKITPPSAPAPTDSSTADVLGRLPEGSYDSGLKVDQRPAPVPSRHAQAAARRAGGHAPQRRVQISLA